MSESREVNIDELSPQHRELFMEVKALLKGPLLSEQEKRELAAEILKIFIVE